MPFRDFTSINEDVLVEIARYLSLQDILSIAQVSLFSIVYFYKQTLSSSLNLLRQENSFDTLYPFLNLFGWLQIMHSFCHHRHWEIFLTSVPQNCTSVPSELSGCSTIGATLNHISSWRASINLLVWM